MLDKKQEPQRNDMPKGLDQTVHAVIQNATHLLEDAQSLEFSDPPTSAWFLTLIAQEELAKAFMLCLEMAVSGTIIPSRLTRKRSLQPPSSFVRGLPRLCRR